MPNGKGSVDCSYCIHSDGEPYPGGFAKERLCRFHETVLPAPGVAYGNRICCHFQPNDAYREDNAPLWYGTVAQRFAWFGTNMKPGTLYQFSYNNPPGITTLAVLRVPDYQNRCWKKPDKDPSP